MTGAADHSWLRIVRGDLRHPTDRLAAAGLRALSWGYGAALRAHLAGYRLGLARRTRLPALVVSIGNLTVGGTGKTTSCLAVASWLRDQGRRAAVLSRGYRGSAEGTALVVSTGEGPLTGVEAAGDEPYLMAQSLPGVSVLVGRDRRRTGAMAVDTLGADTIVLDDGFQYQRLVRDLDIVLVDALAPFGYDALIPRGLLREPVSHLARANAIWLTHCDLVDREARTAIRARVGGAAPGGRVWETVHAPVGLQRLGSGERLAPAALRGRRVCGLSSLGNPVAFERSLIMLGAELAATVRFPDHHRYSPEEVREVCRAEGEWIVTTRKDAARLPQEALTKPAWVLEIALAAAPEATSAAEEFAWLFGTTSAMRR
jgi:tetraacyldisaccharide 4'-kinase